MTCGCWSALPPDEVPSTAIVDRRTLRSTVERTCGEQTAHQWSCPRATEVLLGRASGVRT
jgi:hypothetical protein